MSSEKELFLYLLSTLFYSFIALTKVTTVLMSYFYLYSHGSDWYCLKCDEKNGPPMLINYIQQHGLMIFNNMMKKNMQDYMYKTHGLMIFNYMMRQNIQDYTTTHG